MCIDRTLENLTSCDDGDDGEAGIEVTIFYAKIADVLTFPAKPTVSGSTLFDAAVTITGNIVFKSGKCFKTIQLVTDKGKVERELVGPRKNKSWINKLMGYIANTSPKTVGFVDACKNSDMIFIVKESDGNTTIIGWNDRPANFESAKASSGDAPDSARETEIVIQSSGKAAPYYTGTIALTPAA